MSNMRCVIFRTRDHARPGRTGRLNTSDFEALFGSLVRSLPNHWWTIDGGGYTPWSWPGDWIADDKRMDAIDAQLNSVVWTDAGEKMLASAAFLIAHMQYLSDFWLDIHAFPKRPLKVDQVRYWWSEELPEAVCIPCGATHVFLNVDGAFWTLLTEDRTALEKIANDWPMSQMVDVRPL